MPTNQPKSGSRKKQLNDYVRFSAIGLQMAGLIFLLTWAGNLIDERLSNKVPVFTLVFSLASVTASIWFLIREFSGKSGKNEKP